MRSLAPPLILLLLIQPASYLSIFKLQQYHIRYEIKQRIKAGIDRDELVLLKLPKDSGRKTDYFSWLVPEKELRFKNKMYDIVHEETHGDTSWYYCILDEQETELFANLDKEVNREMSEQPQQEQRRKVLERLSNLLFMQEDVDVGQIRFRGEPELYKYRFGLKTWISSPTTPPPKV
jgi:hypothetical protein